MSRQKKQKESARRCTACGRGQLRYSRYRKVYRCSNVDCSHKEPKTEIADLEREAETVEKERWE